MALVIQTPTPNMEASVDFYQKLGFTVLSSSGSTLVSDGTCIIEINPDRYARPGVKLYGQNWESVVETLKNVTHVHSLENGYLLADPSNTWIYLLNEDWTPGEQPTPNSSVLGNNMGLSLEMIDLGRGTLIWKALGFEKIMGSEEQGWIVYKNDSGAGLSTMKPLSCPHLFFNPSLTFFNGENNTAVIANIRKAGVAIAEEVTHFSKDGSVDNVILRDPGGLGFFVFND